MTSDKLRRQTRHRGGYVDCVAAGVRRILLGLGTAVLTALGSGCVQYDNVAIPADQRGRAVQRATLASATAPFTGNGQQAMAQLGDALPDLLRRGFILMETGHPAQAIHVLNRVLYGTPKPSNDDTALALYLRSRAFQHQGDRVRAIEDCRKARTLTALAGIRRRCDAVLARLDPGARARPATPVPSDWSSSTNLTFVPRNAWNAARPIKRKMDAMGGIHRMTIHHSAVLTRNSSRAVLSQIRSIQGYHMGSENGWGDIGYHFLIDPEGRVWEGRDLRYQGAHARGSNNEHNVGICLLGNFVAGRGGQPLPANQVASMLKLVALLGNRYSIPISGVHTHQELTTTSCPGPRLQAAVDRMRRLLAADAGRATNLGASGGSR